MEHIEISWLTGSVTVMPHDEDTVSFSETGNRELNEDTRMYYWLDGATLRIRFCRSGRWALIGLEKDLTVLVPETLILSDLNVNSISASVCLDSIRADSASINSTSGNVRLTDCAVTELAEVSTVSGRLDAEFAQPLSEFRGGSTSGALQVSAPAVVHFKAASVSGAISLSVQTAPETLDIDTTSGKIGLTLPEDASFTLDYDSTSGELSSDLPCQKSRSVYIFGDGGAVYTVDTVSGDVEITGKQ